MVDDSLFLGRDFFSWIKKKQEFKSYKEKAVIKYINVNKSYGN